MSKVAKRPTYLIRVGRAHHASHYGNALGAVGGDEALDAPLAGRRIPDHHGGVAQRGGQVQIMRREHHRHLPGAIESGEQARDFELIAEIE